MRPIEPGTDSARALEPCFAADLPTLPRLLGVLDGTLAGAIWAADEASPGWVTATEMADGTTYIGGEASPSALAAVFATLRPVSEEIVVGLCGPADPVRSMLPEGGIRWSEAIDFSERVPPALEAELLEAPPGTEVAVMDPALLARTEWYADTLTAFGSIERWLELGLGRALVRGDELCCEATAGPVIRGTMEMGVRTAPEHRGRGYATLTCRHLARDIEARGWRPWWNTNAGNHGSIAVARALGFRRERRYELAWWEAAAFR
ncbi:MAG TPA: GNAT family N-acetyltransferase [Candidatus Limnocylindrales bacterium]|nr:GNAT family N-acetyltransferase [Candidatus Limnocylindrales bacterium]